MYYKQVFEGKSKLAPQAKPTAKTLRKTIGHKHVFHRPTISDFFGLKAAFDSVHCAIPWKVRQKTLFLVSYFYIQRAGIDFVPTAISH